jgi:predicted Holliday junction resolvase-like endonuclease
MFDPIDYIAFNGLSNSGTIESISFIEVKTGEAKLQKNQKQIKRAVQNGDLEIRTY